MCDIQSWGKPPQRKTEQNPQNLTLCVILLNCLHYTNNHIKIFCVKTLLKLCDYRLCTGRIQITYESNWTCLHSGKYNIIMHLETF